jgi:sterol desaturase/sphingolipid hydroxylase (fatty acid hydroxylase superfamily)
MIEQAIAWVHGIVGPEVDWKSVVLTAMTPVFVIAFLVEWQVMRTRGRTEQFIGRDIACNLLLGGAYQLFEGAIHLLLTAALVSWFWQHRLFTLEVTPLNILPLLLGVEFCYYWFHRGSHRIRWFWSAHVVHHSGEHMNLTTAMRQGLLYSITGWWLFFMPLVLLGVHPGVVFFLYGVDLAYQYFVHTESVRKLPGWYEYLFVTPSHHRVHHGRNPQYIDRNFGGILIIFDRWFGTFAAEEEKVDYGLPKPMNSYNIFTVNFREFVSMWRDVFAPGPLWERFKPLWKPPEWERAPSVAQPQLSTSK